MRGRLRSRVERAAVPARRGALHRYGVDATGQRGLRLGQSRHGGDDGNTGLTQLSALLGARHAECERRDVGLHVEQNADLGRPVIVVESRLTERGTVPFRLGSKRLA